MKPDRCTIDGTWPFEHVTLIRFNGEDVAMARLRKDVDEDVAAFHRLEVIHQRGTRTAAAAEGRWRLLDG